VTAKKQQQHKLEFQLGVLCLFFSVCWQHLKVFFQNTKAQKSYDFLLTLRQKRGQQASIAETRKKKVNISWSSLLFFCCG